MVTVAVAGGTGSVGRIIGDALKASQKHNIIVLTRKAPETGVLDVPVFVVDYNNIEQLTKVLDDNKVHTVISTVSVIDEVSGQSERNLIAAADKSPTAKRFIASNWGAPVPSDESIRLPHSAIRLQTLDALRKTDLEWTQFLNGFFLDYYGMPHAPSNLFPFAFVVDVEAKMAGIPGTGNERLALTHTKDLAKFVIAALDLPKWEEGLYCYSDLTTMNELLKVAETNRGTKFNVTYDSVEKLQSGAITELPAQSHAFKYFPKEVFKPMLAKFGLYVINGTFDIPEEKSLNKRFPEIKTTSVEEFLKVWKGK